MALSTRWSPSPVTRPAHSPSMMARPSSSRPSSLKNSMVAARSSTTMPTLSIRLRPMSSMYWCDRRRIGNPLHRAHELEVVVVGIGEGRDPIGRLLADVVWLANDFGACSPELLKVPLYVLALDVEDERSEERRVRKECR